MSLTTHKRVVLFDLGDTLVGYYRGAEFRPILPRCLAACHATLSRLPVAQPVAEPDLEVAWRENHEAPDHRVRPLLERLARIFGVDLGSLTEPDREALAAAFLGPIFAVARPYPDSLPTLRALRERGLRLGIVSNTPWGSPPGPWRREVARHGLADLCEYVGFCTDYGWRKPAPPLFEAALAHFGVPAAACLFVGDNPRWDYEGARALGLDAVLLDRGDDHPEFAGPRVTALAALLA